MSEIRYFLSSCRDDPATLGRAICTHWGIENALHWVLDVTFREDDSRVRDRRAARNLAVRPAITGATTTLQTQPNSLSSVIILKQEKATVVMAGRKSSSVSA
jgi:predicted transposase YbfD/YdcC